MVEIALTDGHRVTLFALHVAAVESVRGTEDNCVVLMVDGTRYTAAVPREAAAAAIAGALSRP